MVDTMHFTIGAEVRCSDGVCGQLSRIIVDPVARTITHLAVTARHSLLAGRLVPLDLVDPASAQLRLRCTLEEFARLDPAEDAEFLPGPNGFAGYGPGDVKFHAYYRLGMGAVAVGGIATGDMGASVSSTGAKNAAHLVVHDAVPLGEVDVRRGEQVIATDGAIGTVKGLVIDPWNHHVTHVLLQEGHVFGAKEVAIPISAVSRVDDGGIRIAMSKDQIRQLPPVDIDHLTS
jgi:sporulation protein YlmC with PRC-barrel domain